MPPDSSPRLSPFGLINRGFCFALALLLHCEGTTSFFLVPTYCKRLQETAKDCKRLQKKIPKIGHKALIVSEKKNSRFRAFIFEIPRTQGIRIINLVYFSQIINILPHADSADLRRICESLRPRCHPDGTRADAV